MSLLKIRLRDIDKDIKEMYEKQIKERDPMDAGFDLFVPDSHEILRMNTSHLINHKVQIEYCQGTPYVNENMTLSLKNWPSHIFMIPRSSMGKSTLRLSNSIGLIDAGYRGDLKAYVDNLGQAKTIEKGTRLFQLIVGENCEIRIVGELSASQRGEGGFGSTGNTL
ncbi:MAG: hypothetical protein H8D23_11605 [Candidatus Brocadiales bacterium]|nr:hypothetical protein [Candidatus Brocadiales bacterium]